MGRLILSLFSGLLGYVFKGIVAKFFVFFALFYITTEFIPVVIDLFIPDSLIPDLKSLFDVVPSSMWYFLNLIEFPMGISLVISALLARFIIRRLPVIG
ncbi:DUF2523 domain-containing protein [Lonepinella koalarum]|uniref:DUF2523 family protein n=1 Tax=Lonepinella koalarum TaxID=53417 RepID=UPI0011E417D1|nr:DUF2523 family protein [Lonepinella koalarum]TYG33308.1 DUF2523 domain-containing protein [Lonepinella koalarum]